jgi:thiol:disulfide interchange protein DsbD
MNHKKTSFRHAAVLSGILLAVWAGSIGAIDINEPPGRVVQASSYASMTSVPQGGTVQIAVEIEIDPPWHINANELTDEFLIPTEIQFEPPQGIEIKGIVYPRSIEKKLAFSEVPLRLYEGTVYIGAVIEVSRDFEPGKTEIDGVLTYQACDDEKCLLPETVKVRIPVSVSTLREPIEPAHSDIFSRIDFGSVGTLTGAEKVGGSSGLGGTVASRGLFVAFLLVFVGGLALNLTPCVYPIIPITVSYFGGQASGSRANTVVLAILYLLGMAAMYSSLGVVAALTGSILGSALQNPFVTAFIALVMVALAASMFGLYEIRVPARLSGVAGTAKQGHLGAFLMGLTVGIVAAPCIGPFVLGLLTFIGERGDPFLGFALFFTLSVGLGIPYVFLAVASGSISKLPRSGEWMEWVRKVFGVILLAMAVYFLAPVLHETAYYVLLGALLVAGGVVLGFVMRVASTSSFFSVVRRGVGVLMPLAGLWFIFAPGHILGIAPGIPWKPYNETYLTKANSERLPVVIDFSAEWCIPCKELEHETFNHPEVVDAAKAVMPLRADLTQTGSPEVVALSTKYDIKGVPTIVFIDRSGKERSDLRTVQFIDKEEFLARLRQLVGGSS